MNLIKLQNKTIKAVKNAAKIFKAGFKSVTEKNGAANLVTDADINIQRFLQRELSKLLPEAGFICEEENVADTSKEYLWVIDPIDGTTNFARGLPECAISVALLYKNEPIMSVVYAPRLKLLFTATKGGGAYCNNKKISVSDKTFEQSIFCVGLSLYQKEFADYCLKIIEQTYQKCSDIRRFGSCALEICFLALGKCDLHFEIRTYPWDYAAAKLILCEAGGVLRGYDNSELQFKDITMVMGANNETNLEKLNNIIVGIVKELPKFEE